MDNRGGQTMTNAQRLAAIRRELDVITSIRFSGHPFFRLDELDAAESGRIIARHGAALLADPNVARAFGLGRDTAWWMRRPDKTSTARPAPKFTARLARKAAELARLALGR
jgi:hypothetical protein